MRENTKWGLTAGERAALDPILLGSLDRWAPTLLGPVLRVLAGGKRLRPSLTIAAAGQRGGAVYSSDVLAGAAAVELLHCATLVHDDVMDDAQSRHGEPTINAGEGVAHAILCGDLLIAAAGTLAARAGPGAALLISETLARLCVGQAQEDGRRFDPTVGEADVLAAAAGKTGSLLAAASRLGGLLAGSGPVVLAALDAFGMAFGTSLQLLDDVLDLTSTAERLGKPVLADFFAGTMTLPVLVSVAGSAELRALRRPDLDPAQHERAVALLRDPQAIAYTVQRASHEAERAATALLDVAPPGSPLIDLARWPRLYLQAQLASKTDPAFLPLVAAAVAADDDVRVQA